MNIAPDIIDAIREHVANPSPKRPGREIVGRIVMVDDEAIRYDRLRNTGRGDGRFKVNRKELFGDINPDEWVILVHNHPYQNSSPEPSENDHKGAHKSWFGKPYAIFLNKSDRLYVWIMYSREYGDTMRVNYLSY